MKRVFVLVLALLVVGALASAEVDLSGMTFDELVALKEQINLAIWNCQEWQEVTIPIGVWKVGEDIPAGHWAICASEDSRWSAFQVGTALDPTGKDIDIMNTKYWYSDSFEAGETNKPQEIDYDFKDGDYLIVEYGPVVFKPFNGKQSLGFK